ncbi:uncharacterized protein GBIM_12787 [Gryllus bimaculatus]|nr:uncharacterized protein GBIM_12787 [Gryllus bimaculatus]
MAAIPPASFVPSYVTARASERARARGRYKAVRCCRRGRLDSGTDAPADMTKIAVFALLLVTVVAVAMADHEPGHRGGSNSGHRQSGHDGGSGRANYDHGSHSHHNARGHDAHSHGSHAHDGHGQGGRVRGHDGRRGGSDNGGPRY